MNEMLSQSPAILGELVRERQGRVHDDVAPGRAGRRPRGHRLPVRGGIAGIAALFGGHARHRAA